MKIDDVDIEYLYITHDSDSKYKFIHESKIVKNSVNINNIIVYILFTKVNRLKLLWES